MRFIVVMRLSFVKDLCGGCLFAKAIEPPKVYINHISDAKIKTIMAFVIFFSLAGKQIFNALNTGNRLNRNEQKHHQQQQERKKREKIIINNYIE